MILSGRHFGADLLEKLSLRGGRWGENPSSVSSLWRRSLPSVLLASASASGRGFFPAVVVGEDLTPPQAPAGEESAEEDFWPGRVRIGEIVSSNSMHRRVSRRCELYLANWPLIRAARGDNLSPYVDAPIHTD